MRNVYLIACAMLFSVTSLHAQPFGYLYSKVITVPAANVSGGSNHLNFPVLFHVTDPDLRTIANGGHVSSSNGFDIIFTQMDCSLSLFHELEYYNPATGEIRAWVRIPVLNAGTNTDFQMYYGNSSVVTSTSSPNTWSSEYAAVWHLGQNPGGAAPQMTDSSPNGNSGTANGGMTAGNSVTAKIGNGLSFDGINDHITIPDFDYSSGPLGFTISFWFRVVNNAGTSYQYMFSHNNYGVQYSLNVYFAENSNTTPGDAGELKTIFLDSNDALNTDGCDAGAGFADGNWHYYTFVVGDAPGGIWIYVDGVQRAYVGFQGSDPFTPPGSIYLGSRSDLNATRFLLGFLDEVRVSSEPRSINWINTEFLNQNSPGTFVTLGAETSSFINCLPLPVTWQEFTAEQMAGGEVELKWSTASEINSDYFAIQRSYDGNTFLNIGIVNAAGNSSVLQSYQFADQQPGYGMIYYRLKQVDYNGDENYSVMRSVYIEGAETMNLFPNPAPGYVNMTYYSSQDEQLQFQLVDLQGRVVYTQQLAFTSGNNTINIRLDGLPGGMYQAVLDGFVDGRKMSRLLNLHVQK